MKPIASLFIFLILWQNVFSSPNIKNATNKTEIIFWHSMAGQLGKEVQKVIAEFNTIQTNVVIKPIYKGEYLESLTSYAAAFRAKKAPDMVQIFEVGTATMLKPEGIIKPVEDLMNEQGVYLAINDFFPVIRAEYSRKGKLMAMPFNSSIPVIFYNANVLKKMGYTASNFPKTWKELESLAYKLRHLGFACAYTSAYPAWILIESFAAIHSLPLVDNNETQAFFNNPKMVEHLSRLRRWQQKHFFEYSGRTDEATFLFTSGRCPLFSQSSGAYKALSEMAPFPVEMAVLPLDENITDKRYPNLAGGAALWVTSGLSAKKYQGIAQFIAFLATPANQEKWHEHTGYLPVGVNGGFKNVKKKLQPSLQFAQTELNSSKHTIKLSGMQNQLRVINEEALEAIFAGIKPPQEALNIAVLRANHVLKRFKENNQ